LLFFQSKIIQENGEKINNNEKIFIKFGKIFEIYANISNKLVGLLLRGKKQQLFLLNTPFLFLYTVNISRYFKKFSAIKICIEINTEI
jgi:hypothetical protein